MTSDTRTLDGGVDTMLTFSADSRNRIVTVVSFTGKPRLGAQSRWPAGSALAGLAHVIAPSGVEWEAIADVQGSFDIVITSVRPMKDGGVASYELHGSIDVELPYTNLPVGDPTLPVTLRIDF